MWRCILHPFIHLESLLDDLVTSTPETGSRGLQAQFGQCGHCERNKILRCIYIAMLYPPKLLDLFSETDAAS